MNQSRSSVILFGCAIAITAGAASADLIVNGGFETSVNTVGTLPTDYGYWRGDVSEIVVAENDITPFEGVQMLRFINTHRNGPSSAVGSELWQIIDVSEFEPLIRSGEGVFQASAFFNRVGELRGSAIDTMFSLNIYSYAGSVDSFPDQFGQSELGSGQTTLLSDGDVQSWEQAMLSFVLHQDTDFVAIRIGATENVFNDLTGVEFHGHYADGVTFNIIPAPSALVCLLPAGLMAIGRRRRSA